MKAKDLMIGDIVRVAKDVCLKKGTIVIVRGIDADNRFTERGLVGSATCVAVDDEDRMSWGIWTEFLEPVPLTVEILEKNGFEKSYSFVLTIDGYKKLPVFKYKNTNQSQDICHNLIKVCVSLDGNRYDVEFGIGSHIFDLEYVHQLQHALRLCGIEKEIEL